MRPTRHLWAASVLAGLLAVLAVVFARPLLLVATALIGAWVLSRQYLFVATVNEAVAGLEVTQSPALTGLRTDGTTPVTLTATLDTPCSLSLSLEAGVPPGGTVTEPLELIVPPDTERADRTVEVHWPIAGRHQFDRATLTMTDGLFTTTLPVGTTPTVTVEPRGPRTTHIGAGGERTAIAQGEHGGGRLGSGLEPAELREYVPGDRTDQIDWNATARLDSVYIREHEAETDRPTLLCLDHRDALSMGPAGETKLDYLREAALAVTASARSAGDPIGLFTVAEKGLTTQIPPALGPTQYASIRRQLLDLAPLETTQRNHATDSSPTPGQPAETATPAVDLVGDGGGYASLTRTASVTNPRTALSQLDRNDDAFTQALEPFYSARQTYSTRVDSDPLVGAIQLAATSHERGLLVLCTDDSDPATLHAAIRQARTKGWDLLVLLTPTVLFEPGGLTNLEQAYDRYVAFEDLRRELGRMERVTALEVTPSERLESVLAAGRRTRGDRR